MATKQMPRLRTVGTEIDHVDVVLNARFFELFSKNLYRSPNKAFEELISNSWDAGATTTYIGIPNNLKSPSATVWVLDNGESMDANGLKQLWRIAAYTKREKRHGREPIGKFGIGKLATYLLAERLTYICKAADGVIRLVEMDYEDIEKASVHPDGTAGGDLIIGGNSGVKLPMNQLSEKELNTILDLLPDGQRIRELILAGVPKAARNSTYENEFGQPDATSDEPHDTWTLAVMTNLKELGQRMQVGWIRYMMRAALPLGESMSIVFNDEPLSPTKISLTPAKELFLDERLGITEFDYQADPDDPATRKKLAISAGREPFPHVRIEGISGPVTGSVKRFDSSISGKKSDQIERSNGFFVNVLGRVVNSEDPYFGLENLNHSVWSEFRMCVRADGLNHLVGINREQLNDEEELRIFRAFLREMFNQMRRDVDDPLKNAWRDAGKVISKSWGAIPLRSFNRALRIYSEGGQLPKSIVVPPGADVADLVAKWTADVERDPESGVSEVQFQDLASDGPLFAYDLEKRAVVVNLAHPFVRMRGKGAAEQAVLRDVAVAETLASARLTDIGVDESLIADYQEYRDELYRVITMIRRDSGVTIAENLITAVDDEKALEILVGNALSFIGFDVEERGERGQPEGIASARLRAVPDRTGAAYSFTYEAKTTGSPRVSAEKVGVSVVDHHRDLHDVNYVLVVAKDFQHGMLEAMCFKAGVTPMRAHDLARLLLLAAGTGPLDLDKFRRVFDIADPDEVARWTQQLIDETMRQQRLSLNTVLDVMDTIETKVDEPISSAVIADRLRRDGKGPYDIERGDINKIFSGLAVLVPSLCRVVKDDIYLGTSPQKFKDAVIQQIAVIPAEFRFALDQLKAPAA